MTTSVAKHWCFTVNNPTPEDKAGLATAWEEGKLAYLVAGNEVGDQGTPHIQGYVVLAKKTRLAGVKKLFPRSHVELARGTPKQASEYCKKDGDFQEWGELPATPSQQGGDALKRKWEDTKRLAKEG